MRMSAKAKGRRTTVKAMTYLRELGMIVDEVELGGKYRESKDLFSNLCTKCWEIKCNHVLEETFSGFDLIALHDNQVLFVQVKTNKPPLQKSYKLFAQKFATQYIRVLAMTWYDRKGWVIHEFKRDGVVNKKDLRHKPNEKHNERK
tara:strand:+ start:699 stop:1136 length:438 start_codon:yes stop_codon:yes gene_type:complete